MFKLFDVVVIKSSGVVGTIVDKTEINGKLRYIVESNTKGEIDGVYGGKWPEYDCVESDLTLLDR